MNFLRTPTEHDWPDDWPHDNGQYFCTCIPCGSRFIGYKRRHVCRKCHFEHTARYEAMTPEKRAAFDREQTRVLQKTMREFFPGFKPEPGEGA